MSVPWTPVLGDIATPGSLSSLSQETAARVAADAALQAAISAGVTSVFGRTGPVVKQANDYNFSDLGLKPTTVAGYGITDAVTPALIGAVSGQQPFGPTVAVGDVDRGPMFLYIAGYGWTINTYYLSTNNPDNVPFSFLSNSGNWTQISWTFVTARPTTIAGYGITADFNSKGDARWLPIAGGTVVSQSVYTGVNNNATISFQVGVGSTQQNAAKFWGNVYLGNNNDIFVNSTNSGFLHAGSFSGVTLGLANGTVHLKAVAAGISSPVAPFIQTTGGAPALSTSAGVAGQFAWDSGFFYVCVAANTWMRTALVTF